MGEFKWEELGYEYKLAKTESPEATLVADVKQIFGKYNLPIFGL